MIGELISHYKVLEKLGSGGMGVVYKAEDTKLKRLVALKFLTSSAVGTGEDRTRFVREAQAAAALNHPNIATIYEINECDSDSTTAKQDIYIVMEFIEGQDLKQQIESGPLKISDAVKIAQRIADGLHAAHEKGIVHRDIKSANIMLDEKGRVKIMDFGLAKLSSSSTLTKKGTTLGTVNYMSPEQTKGEEVDHRSDIWSLGVVLYEMISGQLPFKGDYEQAVIYSILNDEPEPLTALRSGVPIALDGIISKALAKETKIRYQHVDELPADLANVETRSSGTSRITTTPVDVPKEKQQRQWIRAIPLIITAFFALLSISVLIYIWSSEPSVQLSVKRSHINLPETAPLDPIGSTPFRAGRPAFALSPDGANLVYVANSDEGTNLYLRPMNEFEAIPIPGTQGAYAPFFSPNGKWIGFFAEDKLKKVDLSGGSPSTLCEVSRPIGASWGSDNRIIFTKGYATLSWIFADRSSSGTFSKKTSTLWPEVLPGGKAILSCTLGGIKIFFLDSGEEKYIFEGRYSNPKYASTGHILCGRKGRLIAIPFDLKNLKVSGSPVTVIDQVRTESLRHAAQFAISSDGTLLYVSGGYQGLGQLVWVNIRGEEEKLDIPVAEYTTFKISPRGKRLAITIKDPDGWNVWIYTLISGNRDKLSLDGNNRNPVWTPDGKWITFRSDWDGYSNLYRKRVDGRGDLEQLTKNTNKSKSFSPSSWSPDGKILTIEEYGGPSQADIVLLAMDNDGITQPFVNTKFSEWGPVFSPDGRWIAYTSDEQGTNNVYVQPYPQTGVKWRISPENGQEPIWSPTTHDIYYWTYDENVVKWMAVSYTDTPTFKHDIPRTMFKGDFLDIGGRGWDISPIDQRFLVLKPGKDYNKKYTQLNVVTNWFEELKSKMSQDN